MAFLGRLWPAFGRAFYAVFAADWTHVAMHGFLYLVLGLLLVLGLRPTVRRTYLLLFGLALCVGVVHEAIQLLAAGAWPGWGAELLDLSVDMSGASLGALMAVFFRRRRPASVR